MRIKIKAMHELFGIVEGKKCKDCSNFVLFNYHSMKFKKCRCYGLNNNSSSDWTSSYIACGLFNKDYKDERVIELIEIRKIPRKYSICEEEQIEGQINIFDILNN